MIVNTVTTPIGARIFLIDNFFEAELLVKVRELFKGFSGKQDNGWKNPDWTSKRYIYQGTDSNFLELKKYVQSTECVSQLESLLGNVKISNTGLDLWIDLPGFGPLAPHFENEGSIYISQIYISDKDYPNNGTTIYTDDKQILFQLPFRDNFGWFFDKGYTVMHGRINDVEPENRYSVMLWYSPT